jgi:hypothetical protein
MDPRLRGDDDRQIAHRAIYPIVTCSGSLMK